MTAALMALISALAGLIAARRRAGSDTLPYSAVFFLPSNTFHAAKTQTEEVIFACLVTISDIKITVNMPLPQVSVSTPRPCPLSSVFTNLGHLNAAFWKNSFQGGRCSENSALPFAC